MITKAHITRRASRDGVPARTVERGYVLVPGWEQGVIVLRYCTRLGFWVYSACNVSIYNK